MGLVDRRRITHQHGPESEATDGERSKRGGLHAHDGSSLGSRDVRRVCVYAGSNPGTDPAYADGARALAAELAGRGIGIVYGGGKVGLMGVTADTALAAGGDVVGVMPQALIDREIGHPGLTELKVVDSMHERKAKMAELADAFVALPGGIGTLEELIEVYTWSQLGIHDKPCGVLNVNGYYDDLARFLDGAVAAGFLRPQHREVLIVEQDPAELLARLAAFEPPRVAKWLELDQT
jgi:uncharacterized protein (TIGR00730 family)